VLVLASVAIAVHAFRSLPEQRSFAHVCNWVFRLLIGAMWWQQTLWKLPPYYSDNPGQPFGTTGLAYWVIREGKSAAIQLQADFVNNIVLPHFYLFAPVVYGLEVLTAVALMLGICLRLWALIGAAQIVNLWLGLYNAQGEWPWTYFFLLVLQLIFALHAYGRSLGVDALIRARAAPAAGRSSLGRRLLDVVT
jgi:F0F1-type ATP synthase membrane subunit a